MSTLTEENYLKAIYHLSESGGSVSTNALAERMATSAASVTDMLKRLSSKKLVNYKRYKGVKLTDAGERLASGIIRKHRLWECFLVQKLDFNWDEVHDIAEQLEHIESDSLTGRLDAFLGHPKYDPHGDPIPDENGNMADEPQLTLSEGDNGRSYKVAGVRDSSKEFLQYLDSIGLGLGVSVKITEKIPFDGSVMVMINNKKRMMISSKGTENIYIR